MDDLEFVTLKLVDGSELIAVLESQDEYVYVLVKPIEIIKFDNSMIMQNYSYLSKTDEICISKKHVIYITELSEKYISKYINYIKLESGNQENLSIPTSNVLQ